MSRPCRIVAVSGGVDSVVLLHKLTQEDAYNLVVAHFDHGIRVNSGDDMRFVQALAQQYSLPFEAHREELGPHASEALARERRYAFLRQVVSQYAARLVTAHHADDLIETITINFIRGTGWRGLAVLDDGTIERPLLGDYKQDLYDYAIAHGLEWVEDETNNSDKYLRNRVRQGLSLADHTKEEIVALQRNQCSLKRKIDNEQAGILSTLSVPYSRYFFTSIDETIALELLRAILYTAVATGLTLPQRIRLLHAIKVLGPGAYLEAGDGVTIHFSRTTFTIQTL